MLKARYLFPTLCLTIGLWTGTSSVAGAGLDPALECLALNVYHEARGESRRDQYGVAHVVLNRLKHDKWPDTLCEVVSQSKLTPTSFVCQFTWYCFADITPYDRKAWARSIEVAARVYNGEASDPTRGATCFHSTRKKRPNWAAKYKFLIQIDYHRYYDCTKPLKISS